MRRAGSECARAGAIFCCAPSPSRRSSPSVVAAAGARGCGPRRAYRRRAGRERHADRSPAQILLTFSEPVDPTLSHVQLVDARDDPWPRVARATRARRPAAVAGRGGHAARARRLHGRLADRLGPRRPLRRRLYAFGVGVANVGTVAPFGKFVSTSPWLSAVAAAGRWLLYAGLALLLGAAGTCWLVLRGRLPPAGQPLLRLGWLLAAVGVSTVILTERAIVRAPSLLPLFETHEGLAAARAVSRRAGPLRRWPWPPRRVLPRPRHAGRARRRGRRCRARADLGRPRRRPLALARVFNLAVPVAARHGGRGLGRRPALAAARPARARRAGTRRPPSGASRRSPPSAWPSCCSPACLAPSAEVGAPANLAAHQLRPSPAGEAGARSARWSRWARSTTSCRCPRSARRGRLRPLRRTLSAARSCWASPSWR